MWSMTHPETGEVLTAESGPLVVTLADGTTITFSVTAGSDFDTKID